MKKTITTRECPVCARPVKGTILDNYCTDTILAALTDVPMLLAELEVNATRQSVSGPGRSGGRSSETPLPYGQRAADATQQLISVLTGWAKAINPAPATYTALTAATYLRTHIKVLRQHAEAGKAYKHLTEARDHAMSVIDRPPDTVPAGRCDADLDDGTLCPEILYADPDRASVRCKCGAEHPTDRTWMLDAARDQEWTAAEIGKVTPGVTAAMVRRYAQRGLLTQRGNRHIGPERTTPTYRVGDLLDLLTPAQETA